MTVDEENKIMWNALRDIAYQSKSQEESQRIAQAAFDAVCPFLPLIAKDAVQAPEEARKAS